jgi:TolA-binding protein
MGIGATLAFQSYREKTIELVRAEVPSLAWLLPVSTAKPPEAASSPQLVQQLEAILAQQLEPGFVAVRRSVEQLSGKLAQLAAQQDQMTKTIESLQAAEQEISQKLSARTAVPRKPPQPAEQSAATQPSPVSLAPPQQPSR